MGDKVKVCQACLASDRVLYNTAAIMILLRKINLQINENGGICWECKGMAWKFYEYKSKVLRAQEVLQNTHEIKALKSLSNLSFSKPQIFHISTKKLTDSNETDVTAHNENDNITFQERQDELNVTCQEKQSEHQTTEDNRQESQKVSQLQDRVAIQDEDKNASKKTKGSKDLMPKTASLESMKDQDVSEIEPQVINVNNDVRKHQYNNNAKDTNEIILQDKEGNTNQTTEDKIDNNEIPTIICLDDSEESIQDKKDDSRRDSRGVNQSSSPFLNNENIEDAVNNLPKITMVKSIEEEDLESICERDNSVDIIELNINIPCILIEDDDETDFEQQTVDRNQESRKSDETRRKDFADSTVQVIDLDNERQNFVNDQIVVIEDQSQCFFWNRAIKQEKDLTHSQDQSESDMKNELDSDLDIMDITPEFSIEVKAEPLSPEPCIASEREYELWKKSVLLVYNRLRCHRYASTFLNPIRDDRAPSYSLVVKHPMDLKTVARNVRNGTIRSTPEFHRDLLLMLTNAVMYNNSRHVVHHMAKDFLEEVKNELGILLTVQEVTCLNTTRSPRSKRRLPIDNNTVATSTPSKKIKMPLPICYVKMERIIDLTDVSTSDDCLSPQLVPRPTNTSRIKAEKTNYNTAVPITNRRKSCRSKTKEKSSNIQTFIEKLNDTDENSKIKPKPAKRYSARKSVCSVIETENDQETTKYTSTTYMINDTVDGSKSIRPAKRTYSARKSCSSIIEAENAHETTKYTNTIERLNGTVDKSSSIRPAKRTYSARKSCSSVIKAINAQETKNTITIEKLNDIDKSSSTRPAKLSYATRKSISCVLDTEKDQNTNYTTTIEKLNDSKENNSNSKAAKRLYATRKSFSGVIDKDNSKTKYNTHKTKVENIGFIGNMVCTQYTVPLKDAPVSSKVQKRRYTIGGPLDTAEKHNTSPIITKVTETIQKPKRAYNRRSKPETNSKRSDTKPKCSAKKLKGPVKALKRSENKLKRSETKLKRSETIKKSKPLKKGSTPPDANAEELAEMLLNVSTCFENMTSEDEANTLLEPMTEDPLNAGKKRRLSTKSCHDEIPKNKPESDKPQKRKRSSNKIKTEPTEKKRGRRRKNETDITVTGKNKVRKGIDDIRIKDIDSSMLENTSLLTPKKKKNYYKKVDKTEKIKKLPKGKRKDTSNKSDEASAKTIKSESEKTMKKIKSKKGEHKEDKRVGHRPRGRPPKNISIKQEIDTVPASLPTLPNDSGIYKTETSLKEAPTTSVAIPTVKKINVLSSKIIKPKNIFKDLKLESQKFAHSTPKEPYNASSKFQDNLSLATAITTETMRDLTREESGVIKKTLEDAIMEISLDAKRFAPKFRGKPIIADGVVKLWCEDYNSLLWLENIVSKINSIPDLVVRKQCELPKKMKCAILLPGNEDFEVMKRLLKAQNPWALVDSWLHHSVEQRGENMYLVVGIPSTVIPALEGKERKLAYSLGSVDVQFLKEDGNNYV